VRPLWVVSGSAIGRASCFPRQIRTADPEAPFARRVASRWLLKAESLAELQKLPGGIWHRYRRAWATERKHMPDVDGAAAGGWSDTRALKVSYQQADATPMLRVVEGA
jgi:hypothetical protein